MKAYEKPFYQDEELLNKFLDTWSPVKVAEMTLEEYTGVDDKYTFTQWVENRTRLLGSINGRIGSSKFGIYKRKNRTPEKNLISNETYSWIKYYGECDFDEQKVFVKVRNELLKLIEHAQNLDFEAIEKIKGFYQIYKWKVAFLYSDMSMVPVFNQQLLIKFTAKYGMHHTKKVEYAKMHRFLYDQKPPNLSVFNFMRKLFYEEGLLEKGESGKRNPPKNPKRVRKGTDVLNTDNQIRKGTEETLVTQHHRTFQTELKAYLEAKYPKAEILFEKNFIDVLLLTNDEVHFYEVKTAQTPEACIKQGLGQLLNYSFFEEHIEKKYKGFKKKIVIFGKWKPKSFDIKFIDYVNNSLNVNFEYLSLEEISRAYPKTE